VRYQQRKVEREAEYSRRLEAEVRDRTQELVEQNVRLEELNTQLAEASLTDSLTGFRNRRFLFEEVARDAALVQRGHATHKDDPSAELPHLVFVMVDLDHFKPINDTCGHAAGDRVLLQVRDVLTQACRSSDILIRWGGDEFLVVGREVDLQKAHIVPERIRAMIERQAFDVGDGQVAHLSCSIGFTQYPFVSSEPHALSLDQAVALADRALYIAKNNGRNAWVGFLATQKTVAEEALGLLRDDPGTLREQGRIEIRTSISTAEHDLTWS
jgi:diguanylate cyclase (GGDEF)-like protein